MSTQRDPERRLDAFTLRRLAVAAECDPRTILRVLHGAPFVRQTVARDRARAVLVKEGLLARGARSAGAGR